MPQPRKGKRLGGSASHQKAMMSNLARSLIEHERLETTQTRAKEMQPLVEKLVGLAKRGDLHARRQALAIIQDRDIIHKLFDEIGPRYEDREGGYSRIVKTGPRKGDAAPMAIIEFV
ncbi:MAG: 50S ribosomal protein L17 [Actinomycetota bacterium]|nr:50S ribosomal protein L17 [Actinomycetota bacterium]MDD5666415.1 50S ribosomal protein L17 [Actinomycetota bacterium]